MKQKTDKELMIGKVYKIIMMLRDKKQRSKVEFYTNIAIEYIKAQGYKEIARFLELGVNEVNKDKKVDEQALNDVLFDTINLIQSITSPEELDKYKGVLDEYNAEED